MKNNIPMKLYTTQYKLNYLNFSIFLILVIEMY